MMFVDLVERSVATFIELMNDRLEHSVFTTEDSVRYTFFAALLAQGVAPHQVVLEYPHPKIKGAEVDTWITPSEKVDDSVIAIEFKYDRTIPSGYNQPKTQKAGSVFRDLQRQALLAEDAAVAPYFVYLATLEMAKYFSNPKNGLSHLWHLKKDEQLSIDEDFANSKAKTFLSQIMDVKPFSIVGVVSSELANRHYLKVYKLA